MYFSLLLLTLNVPLPIGKYTCGGTCTTGWEPQVYSVKSVVLNSR